MSERPTPRFSTAVGQNASLASDINSCAENPFGAGVTNGFYLLLENTAVSHPLHAAHTSPLPVLQSPAQGAGNRAARGTICFCQHLCRAPTATSVEKNSVLDELLERHVWSLPWSLLVVTELLGSRGPICVYRLPGLICTDRKSLTGS